MMARLEQNGRRPLPGRLARFLAPLASLLICAIAADASAQVRAHEIRWIPPAATGTSFTVYLGGASGAYDDSIDLGPVAPDGDGVSRATLQLDAGLDYFIAMTARNANGESGFSNEIFVPAATPPPSPGCASGADCPQSRAQQACLNASARGLASITRAQTQAVSTCMRNYALRGDSAATCLGEPSSTLDRMRGLTISQMWRSCRDEWPDFGTAASPVVSAAAIQSVLGLFADVFGSSPDAALMTRAESTSGVTCQSLIFRFATMCQAAYASGFASCARLGLIRGTIGSKDALEACFPDDSNRRVAVMCDPVSGLVARLLPTLCRGVDLSDAFPGVNSDAPGVVAGDIADSAECRVCEALNDAHNLSLDCSTCP